MRIEAKRWSLALGAFCLSCSGFAIADAPEDGAPEEVDWYLPWAADYKEDIPTPEEVLGWQVGERHVNYDQLIRYYQALDEASDRVSVRESKRTYGLNPMLEVRITTPENQENAEEIRTGRLEAMAPGSDQDLTEYPLVNYLGYSIHGDEHSGASASMVVAWHLAAAKDDRTQELLEDNIVLIEPAMNPDGVDRFATWVNSHRGETLTGDPQNREHRQAWPRARTNHYWFDLNRDWLPVQHPESRHRVELFHDWRPNIVGDWHEMGRQSTYFFQPGDPDRNNPRTPELNYELTANIAEYHGRILDEHGVTYFTEEVFDDYYYGKGSTYPDIQGSIGILYEQASARGHLRETRHGERSYAEAVRNQTLTSFSALEAGHELREELLDFQQGFFEEAMDEARSDRTKGFIFGDAGDPGRNAELVELLLRQDVDVLPLEEDMEVNGERFEAGNAWVIPTEQAQYRFIRAMWDRQHDFPDTWFYDVSTWTLPLAFNMPNAELSNRELNQAETGKSLDETPEQRGRVDDLEEPVAWVFDWKPYYAPKLLNDLLEEEVRARVSTESFTANTNEGERDFDRGSIVIPVGKQDEIGTEELPSMLRRNARDIGVEVSGVTEGLTPRGIDMGSPSLENVEPISPMIIVGDGVSMLEAGELWHLLDYRWEIPVSLVEHDELETADLDRYTHVFMVDGNWSQLSDGGSEALKEWTRDGGTLVAQKSGLEWVKDSELYELEFKSREKGDSERLDYADFPADRAAQVIGGSIFHVDLDLTHPLAYGYDREKLPVLRNSTRYLKPSENPYINVGLYDEEEPRLSGYVSEENLEAMAGTASIMADTVGSGEVILFTDNPSFRAFFFGTNRLIANSLFFSEAIGGTERQ